MASGSKESVSSKIASIERPAKLRPGNRLFASDAIADTLRSLDIPYIALTPGASYRGLHDSLVNYLGNEKPQMLVTLHEEHAIAIAHGYGRITGRPMLAAVHSNVGLLHGSMALFNAWCDRAPLILLNATGPLDAMKRRAWIEWVHTSRDQAALVRPFVKWDDEPASAGAAREAILRGAWLTQTYPTAPVYINLDAELQESVLPEALPEIEPARFLRPAQSAAPEAQIAAAATLLKNAKRPVMLVGRCTRDLDGWNTRVKLAEALGARVLAGTRTGASFPNEHELCVENSEISPKEPLRGMLAGADVILSFEWIDLGSALRGIFGGKPPTAKIIQVSMDHTLHGGALMDYMSHPAVDVFLAGHPDLVAAQLLKAVGQTGRKPVDVPERKSSADAPAPGRPISLRTMVKALREAVGARPSSVVYSQSSWPRGIWPLRHPLDHLGGSGGAGIGAGPGLAVGGALALRDSGRLPLALCGDGDFVMGCTALWTAVHYRIPLLIVIGNNTTYLNDEVHQEHVAEHRARPVENRWIGMRMEDPAVDLAGLARAQGATGFGPVEKPEELADVFQKAIAAVEAGAVAVVDVRIAPR